VVNRVVEDFLDVVTPLKQFTEAVLAPEGTPHRDQTLADKAQALEQFSSRAAKTARMVAAGASASNKKFNQALLSSASQVSYELFHWYEFLTESDSAEKLGYDSQNTFSVLFAVIHI